VLDRRPAALHERAPLIMGSLDKVERIIGYHRDLAPSGEVAAQRS